MNMLLKDLTGSLVRWRIWLSLAYEDLQDRYRRSYIGILWISITFVAFVGAYVFVFQRFISIDGGDYRVYILFGWAAWQLISSIVSDATIVMEQSRGYILSSSLPYFTYYFRIVTRNMMTFSIMILTAIAAAPLFDFHFSLNQLSLIPALATYYFTGIWMSAFLGPISARFRDINHIVSTVMRVAFFMTPVIWYPESTNRALSEFSQYNPFFHYIEIIRTPMVFNEIPWESWIVVGGISLFFLVAGSLVFILTRRWVPFWL